jgi:hypothetical protein
VWSVNYLTAQGHYVGLEQAAGWSAQWQNSVTQGGVSQGSTQVSGGVWDVLFNQSRDIRAFVQRTTGRTTMVLVKNGSQGEGPALIASLSAGR